MRYKLSAIARQWLGRLSFSFLVVAFLLTWQGYKRFHDAGDASDWRTVLYFGAAGASLVLALTGLRERHRH